MKFFSCAIVIGVERENFMKKTILTILFGAIIGILSGSFASSEAACAPVGAGSNVARTTVGTIQMNTMSPATYKYPASYAHTTTVVKNNTIGYAGAPSVVSGVGGTNVNVYVGGPYYVMRSGMVRIKHRPRKGRVGTLYPDVDYYGY